LQRNGQKREKTKPKGKTVFSPSTVLQKTFDMDFFHFCYSVFELPLLRNAQKRHKTNKTKRVKVPIAGLAIHPVRVFRT
jgi:hypothetical protein